MEDHIEHLELINEKIGEVDRDKFYNQNRLNEVVNWLFEGVAIERGWKPYSQNHRAWLKGGNGYFQNNASDYIIGIVSGELPKKAGKRSSNTELIAAFRAVRVTKLPTKKGIIYLATGLINSVNMAFTSHFFDRYKERCMGNKGTRNDAIRHFFIKEFFTGMCGIEENQKRYEVKHTKAVYKNGMGMGVSRDKAVMIKTYVSNAELNERNIDFHKDITDHRPEYERLFNEACKERVLSAYDDHQTIKLDEDSDIFTKQHILGANKCMF